jgi:hypothetical protein
MAGEKTANPLTPRTTHRIPAASAGLDEVNWQVTSAGLGGHPKPTFSGHLKTDN